MLTLRGKIHPTSGAILVKAPFIPGANGWIKLSRLIVWMHLNDETEIKLIGNDYDFYYRGQLYRQRGYVFNRQMRKFSSGTFSSETIIASEPGYF